MEQDGKYIIQEVARKSVSEWEREIKKRERKGKRERESEREKVKERNERYIERTRM